jgi:phytoene dehydrogenase-like protein
MTETSPDTSRRAVVIGSGPNGLAAAITLARTGRKVTVYEAEQQPGGAARTMELTLPGFRHDFGSAVHPMAAASPFFAALPLKHYGLEWVHGPTPLAHPLDDGRAVVLERDLNHAEAALGRDGRAWRKLVQPLVEHWPQFAKDALGPVARIPHHPFLMAKFGLHAFQPAISLASQFSDPRTRALFAGLAAHSFLALDQPLSSAIGLILGAVAHVVGWPIPRGGSQSITNALIAQLCDLDGEILTGRRIASLDELDGGEATILCDITPRQLLSIAGNNRLRPGYARRLRGFRYGAGVFKIDYALREPIPWRAAECRRSITIHVGGTMEEIAQSEHAATHGAVADRPFVIVAQPSLFDPTRAPEGMHTAWVYCHVPNGSNVDMTNRIEDQLERFAPGFRECVLARRMLPPAALESMNANLVGGDINGGELSTRQFFFRPSLRGYSTGTPNLYLCSSSTPPGGGVHGMCGYLAAHAALRNILR